MSGAQSAAPGLVLRPLRAHAALCPFFVAAFEAEWPSWYGPHGPGHAGDDLAAFANPEGVLPVGLVALAPDGQPVGVAALKAESIPSHAHLLPWAAAGYVAPSWRRRGVGTLLLRGLLKEAARLGHQAVYCATATSASLLRREGWQLIDRVDHDGHGLEVFRSPEHGARTSHSHHG